VTSDESKTGVRSQESEVRRLETGGRIQEAEDRRQKNSDEEGAEFRSETSGVKSRGGFTPPSSVAR
jgi:hypothetical protein